MYQVEPVLFDDDAAVEWGKMLGIPPGYAKELVSHFRRVAERTRTQGEWGTWCQAEEQALHSHPQYKAKNAKVARWLGIGQATPFGQALSTSHLRHSAEMWHTIAEHSP